MSKIRVFKCSEIYQPAYQWFNQQFPSCRNLSYADHFSLLMQQRIQWSDFWKRHLEGTGHFVVEEILRNAPEIQAKWASENGFKWAEGNKAEIEIVIAQAREFKPDVFFAHSFPTYSPELITRLRREVPSIRIVIGWDGIAHCNPSMFSGRDIMFTCADFISQHYRDLGLKAFTIPFAFDAIILEELGECKIRESPSFLGTLHLGGRGHNERTRMLHEIQKKSDYGLDLYVSMPKCRVREGLRVGLGYFRRFEWDVLPKAFGLFNKSLGSRFGLDMFRAFAESPLTLNAHIDAAGSFAGNIRLFDATGSGTCLVTDHKNNLNQFFDIDREIVTFKNHEECIEKVNWLMNHEENRLAIAHAGQKRTLREHSYHNRLKLVAEILTEALN